MGLFPKKIADQIPPSMAQEGIGDDSIVYVKFFNPIMNWAWYVTEYDPADEIFFGLVKGIETEWGYFSLLELKNAKATMRDISFSPTRLGDITL